MENKTTNRPNDGTVPELVDGEIQSVLITLVYGKDCFALLVCIGGFLGE